MTVEAIWVLWTCHIQETSLRWFELCDMVRYPAGSRHHNIGTLWSLKHGHGQQQHPSRLWCLSDAQLVLRGPKCSKKISPEPLHHHQPEPFIFRMCPCIHVVAPILILPPTFFQSSIVKFWWACANCSLSFMFLASISLKWFGHSPLTPGINKAFFAYRTATHWIFLFFRTFSVNPRDGFVWNSQ